MATLLFLDELWYEKLGPMYISAAIKAHGHKCIISIGRFDDFRRDIEVFRPDLIGFSAMTMEMNFVRKTSSRLKRSGIKTPIIVGGIHATFFPEIIEDENIDLVCVGEAETSMTILLDKIDKKESFWDVPNIWFKENGKIVKNQINYFEQNLDNLPFPDRELYRRYKYFRKNIYFAPVMTKRGCPFECSYCFNVSLKEISNWPKKHYVRYRSVDNVIAELEIIKKKYHPKYFLFQDGTFVINDEWTFDFCRKYKEKISIPFTCHIRPERISENLIIALKTAGCDLVKFGIESGSQRIRSDILNRKVKDDQIIRMANWLRKNGIKFYTFNMMGLPTETFVEAWRTIELNRKIKPYAYAFDLYIPYPKTKLANFSLEKKIIKEEDFNKLHLPKYNMYQSILRQAEIDRVVNLLKLYWPSIKFSFLSNFWKEITKLPPNFLFDFIYNFSIAWQHRKDCRLSIFRLIAVIIKNFKIFK
ncbi:MAG: B12-binding domain-containing radical SAM protein [Candidatus Aminicenantes bacterium]|nr:B12-binding domain-containing radical SAM protein [Candidatus Aminicenantes bacterium]